MPAALMEEMGAKGYFGIRLPEDAAAWGSACSSTA